MQKKTGIMQTTRLMLLAILSFSIPCATGTAQATSKALVGQRVTALIDRAEVRVLKIDLQPGTAVPRQARNDVKFSLFLPITSGIELTIGSEQPVLTEAGRGFFILPGMPYSIRNPGKAAASAFEVLVNDPAAATGQRGALGGALAESGSLVHVSFMYAQVPDGTAPAGSGAGTAGTAGGNGGGGGLITTEIDRAEVRLLRNQVAPGQVHSMHSHDDVVFHLLMPITPGIELTVGSEKPVMLEPGQAVFLLGGTQHAFRNSGTTTPAVAYEVFVNDGPAAATAAAIKKEGRGAEMASLAANRIN